MGTGCCRLLAVATAKAAPAAVAQEAVVGPEAAEAVAAVEEVEASKAGGKKNTLGTCIVGNCEMQKKASISRGACSQAACRSQRRGTGIFFECVGSSARTC